MREPLKTAGVNGIGKRETAGAVSLKSLERLVMLTRFDQARLLIKDAKSSFAVLSSLEMYERILEANKLTDDFPMGVYRSLMGLTSALEYCAREVHSRCVAPHRPLKKDQTVTFPIAPKGRQSWSKDNDFVAWAQKTKVPGLNDFRPDLITKLGSFQEFADPFSNGWFPDFAILSNETKHDQFDPSLALTTTGIRVGGVMMAGGVPGRRGIAVIDNCEVNGKKTGVIVTDGHRIWSTPEWDKGLSVVRESQISIRFNATDVQVLPFLRRAIAGAESIAEDIIKTV